MEIIKQIKKGDLSGIDLFIDSLFDLDTNESLDLIQDIHSRIIPDTANENEKYFLVILDSFWNFFQSQLSIHENADFQQALNHVQIANEGFTELGLLDFQDLSLGFQVYYSAILDIKTFNLKSGLEKIDQAKTIFEKIDKYGKHFGVQTESLEAESLFITGMTFLLQRDFVNGQIAVEKASKASKNIAIKYFEKDAPGFNFFTGLSHQYQTTSNFTIQSENLTSFNFEFFDYADNEALQYSQKAMDYFTKSLEIGEIALVNLNLAKGMTLIIQVQFDIGQCMYSLLKNNRDSITFVTKPLKKSIKNAKKFFSSIGDDGIILIRATKVMEEQLINIDRFLKSRGIVVKDKDVHLDLSKKVKNLVKNGRNEKAIDYLSLNTIDFDAFSEIILLKARYTKLKKENILGIISKEDFRLEDAKISKLILDFLKLLEDENLS